MEGHANAEMQKVERKKKKKERFDKTVKTRRLALDILKTRYSVRCEIRKYEKKKKKKTQNKEMIPLKESLEMFYILRVALKRRCKDAFFFLVDSCIARTTFLLFFPSLPLSLQTKQ